MAMLCKSGRGRVQVVDQARWVGLSNVVRTFTPILAEGILEERLIVVDPAKNASGEDCGPAGRFGPLVRAGVSSRVGRTKEHLG